jgi:predicted nucleic acid-binding protein
MRNSVFADAYYYLALIIPRADKHQQAVDFAAQFTGQIVTTAWVMIEVANALGETRHRSTFPRLLDGLKTSPQSTVIPPAETLFDAGVELYRNRPDKGWSLTDCISFLVMEREGLTEALTGDHHFEQAGFVALLK